MENCAVRGDLRCFVCLFECMPFIDSSLPCFRSSGTFCYLLFTIFVKSCVVLAWFHVISFLQPKAAEPQGAAEDQLWVARHPRQPQHHTCGTLISFSKATNTTSPSTKDTSDLYQSRLMIKKKKKKKPHAWVYSKYSQCFDRNLPTCWSQTLSFSSLKSNKKQLHANIWDNAESGHVSQNGNNNHLKLKR